MNNCSKCPTTGACQVYGFCRRACADETPFTLNGSQTVAVATEVFLDPDMTKCPRGVKVQLEGGGGVLVYGAYTGDPFWVSWAPCPRRRPPDPRQPAT